MEKKFVEGMSFYKKDMENMPWLIGQIWWKPEDLIAFSKQNIEHITEKGWLKADLKKSSKGNYYLELNTWKPEKKNNGLTDEEAEIIKQARGVNNSDEISAENIPF